MTRALIIGGTRGIGRAMALHYVAQGWEVVVAGRDPAAVDGTVLAAHPAVTLMQLDITDRAAVQAAVREAAGPEGRLDLLLVTAGLYFNSRTHPLDAALTEELLRTNVLGLTYALEAGAALMLRQGHGRIAAVASMAGLLRDYPGASAYAASKRAVLALCATWRKALAPFGVVVTAIVPGYVDTERLRALNGGSASGKPFLLSEAEAVRRIAAGLKAGVAVCAFPRRMHALVWLLNRIPWLLRWRA